MSAHCHELPQYLHFWLVPEPMELTSCHVQGEEASGRQPSQPFQVAEQAREVIPLARSLLV